MVDKKESATEPQNRKEKAVPVKVERIPDEPKGKMEDRAKKTSDIKPRPSQLVIRYIRTYFAGLVAYLAGQIYDRKLTPATFFDPMLYIAGVNLVTITMFGRLSERFIRRLPIFTKNKAFNIVLLSFLKAPPMIFFNILIVRHLKMSYCKNIEPMPPILIHLAKLFTYQFIRNIVEFIAAEMKPTVPSMVIIVLLNIFITFTAMLVDLPVERFLYHRVTAPPIKAAIRAGVISIPQSIANTLPIPGA